MPPASLSHASGRSYPSAIVEEDVTRPRPTLRSLASSFEMNLSSWHQLGFATVAGAFALGSVATLAESGCTVLTNDAPPDDAGVFEGGDAIAPACSTCVVSECTAAWALCLTDESCRSVRSCATNEFCESNCAQSCTCGADAGVANLYRAFATCNDMRTCTGACATDCASSCTTPKTTTPPPCDDPDASIEAADGGTEDAGDADVGDAAPSSPTAESCASCAADKCDGASKACVSGSECAAYLACMFGCGTSDCASSCEELHATGKVAAIELASCTGSSCTNECGL